MVLVTGATGLVGSHLLLHLIENGEIVRAFYRKSVNIQKTKKVFSHYKKDNLFEKVNWFEADILDIPSLENAFDDVDYVYHCAAFISFDPRDEATIRKTNIEGTANVVNFCLAKNVSKICFVSSISALGDIKDGEKIITEDTEWNPEKSHSDYAISKYGSEMEIWRGQQEGLKCIIVNPGVILGPKFWEDGSGALYKKVSNGFPFYTKGTTGFVAVIDVVQIMVKLMKTEISNERFSLVSDSISFQELFNSIADSAKVKRPYIYINSLAAGFLWRVDWFFSTFFRTKRNFDKESAIASQSKNTYSNEKIKIILKHEFLDIHSYIKDN